MPIPPLKRPLLAAAFLLPLTLPHVATAHGEEAASAGGAPQSEVLQREALPGGQMMIATRLHVPPGGSAPAHRHAGTLMAYMLSGQVRSGLNDADAVLYGPGQSWTEPEGTHHTHFENASETEPAELLVVFVAPANATLTNMDK